MQNTAVQLKHKLLRALDDDNNVVDMSTVLEVISRLETIPVTRETLEQTRLGKYVNEMRRKTSSKDLAKRAKNLVRKWKQLVENQASGEQSTTSSINGDASAVVNNGGLAAQLASRLMAGRTTSPASRPSTPSGGQFILGRSSTSPVSRPGTPSSITGGSRLAAGKTSVSPASRPGTPSSLPDSRPNSGGWVTPHQSSQSPALPSNHPVSPKITSRDTDNTGKRKRRLQPSVSPPDQPATKKLALGHLSNSQGNGHTSSPNGLITGKQTSSCDISQQNKGLGSRTGSQPMLRGPSKSPELKQTPSFKRNANLMDAHFSGSVTPRDKLNTSVSKTPKVKTTAQLIEGLKASGGLRLNKSSETVNKIANNMIDKEVDYIRQSVVPRGALPRARRKPNTPIVPPTHSDRSLQQTKTELVQKFLQTSLTPSNSEIDLSSTFKTDSNSRTESPTNLAASGSALFGSMDNSPSSTSNTLAGNHKDSSIFYAEAQPVMFFIGDEDIKQENELTQRGAADPSDSPAYREYLAALARDPWSFMPPLNEEELDWTSLDYEPVVRPEVTDEMVRRMETEVWEGVNGMRGHDDEIRDSTDSLTLPSLNGDLLHILPYVDIV